MKLNWGFGILIFILAFVVFMLTLVYKCSMHKVDLVSEKYYENEIRFQEQINKEQNSLVLQQNVTVSYNGFDLIVKYPENVSPDSIGGDIELFRPDDSAKDRQVLIVCNDNHIQTIPASDLAKGSWSVNVNWSSGNIPYYFQQKIMIR